MIGDASGPRSCGVAHDQRAGHAQGAHALCAKQEQTQFDRGQRGVAGLGRHGPVVEAGLGEVGGAVQPGLVQGTGAAAGDLGAAAVDGVGVDGVVDHDDAGVKVGQKTPSVQPSSSILALLRSLPLSIIARALPALCGRNSSAARG